MKTLVRNKYNRSAEEVAPKYSCCDFRVFYTFLSNKNSKGL